MFWLKELSDHMITFCNNFFRTFGKIVRERKAKNCGNSIFSGHESLNEFAL